MSDIPVFALTARGRTQWHSTDIAGVDQFTHEQLNRVGIDFSRTVIPAGLERLEAAYFYNGILFAQHIKKGDLLKHLLKDLDYRPASIIFVDDNPGQLVSVEAAVKELDIPFVGFWYRRTEFTYPNFNPLIAVAQLESLLLKREILSDDEAHELLPNLQELESCRITLSRFWIKLTLICCGRFCDFLASILVKILAILGRLLPLAKLVEVIQTFFKFPFETPLGGGVEMGTFNPVGKVILA